MTADSPGSAGHAAPEALQTKPRPTTAFILGAGLGTRLRPLTTSCPKPLIPFFQRRIIEFAFAHLAASGIQHFLVNTHHAADVYERLFPQGIWRDIPITFRHEPILLDTGGGIRNMRDWLDDSGLLVYNGDVLTDLPLDPLIAAHAAGGAVATVALRPSDGPLRVAFDPVSGRILDINNLLTSGHPMNALFTGQYIVDPGLLDFIDPQAPESVITALLLAISAGRSVRGVWASEGHWFDLGNRQALLAAHHALAVNNQFPRYDPGRLGADWKTRQHATARVKGDARLEGLCVLAADTEVGNGTRLTDCILHPGACVGSGARLERVIVGENATVPDNFAATDLDFGL